MSMDPDKDMLALPAEAVRCPHRDGIYVRIWENAS